MSNYKMVPHRRLKNSQIENLIIYILNMISMPKIRYVDPLNYSRIYSIHLNEMIYPVYIENWKKILHYFRTLSWLQ